MSKKLINISIDDVSPHPQSSTKVLDRCYDLIAEFSDIKFTLFVPVAYWRTRDKACTSKPLFINEHPEFCQIIKNLPVDNFEIGYHGFFHGIPGLSNNDEFQYLTYEQAIKKFNDIFHLVKLSDLNEVFKPIFRPPAWRMSPAAIQAAEDLGIDVLALSPQEYAKKTYEGRDKTFNSVVYYNVNPPFIPLQAFDRTEVVYHACEWDKNFLATKKTKNLIDFLKNLDNYEFCFIKGLV